MDVKALEIWGIFPHGSLFSYELFVKTLLPLSPQPSLHLWQNEDNKKRKRKDREGGHFDLIAIGLESTVIHKKSF